jgi:hypothetical protein
LWQWNKGLLLKPYRRRFVEFMGSNPSLEAQLAALKQIRAMNAALYEKEIPLYSRAVAACTHAQFTVHTDHDGQFDVPVLVHTPKG